MRIPLKTRVPLAAQTDLADSQNARGTFPIGHAGAKLPDWLNRAFERIHQPRFLAETAILLGILFAGFGIRLHFAAFLDPFEDGYQNWWISANLLQTGQYWDRHSMMTQGNWLPLYHFWGAAVLAIAGWHNFAALKFANISLSLLTASLVYVVGRRNGATLALAGAAFFSLNFIDIVVSGWSTAESLAGLLVFLGYASFFRFDFSRPRNRWIGAAAFLLAVLTRYEAWLVVGLVAAFALYRQKKGTSRRALLTALIPAIGAMVAYFLYSLQWGFLPQIIINQTSADIRYQLSVGTQPSVELLLSRFWTGYVWFFPLVFAVGVAHALISLRHDVGGWIVLSFWGFIFGYTMLRFGNPSYRYVMIGVPLISLLAAEGLGPALRRVLNRITRNVQRTRYAAVALAIGVLLLSATMVAAPVTFWNPGFETRRYMEPMERAGQYLAGVQLPEGKILISESPIAAYYCGYPPDRVLGSRWLPDERATALQFLRTHAAFVVYMGVPYYKLRTLFPELQNGTSTMDFELLYDAGGLQIGTHAVFVYKVLP